MNFIFTLDVQKFFAELQLQEFAQELLILAVFFVGWHAWRRVGTLRKTRSFTKSSASLNDHKPHEGDLSDTATSSLTTSSRVAPVWLTDAEKQLLQYLEDKEFTRAMQLFRRMERRLVTHAKGLSFTMDALKALVRTGIRVGNFDVLNSLLPAVSRLRDAGEPVRDFWYTALKMIAFRKRFDICLDVYRSYREHLPEDQVVYSCLINAALEVGDVAIAQTMLSTYKRTELDVADHVLIFRTCLAATDVDGAVENFKKLGCKTTPLMFNHLLSTCVEAKRPAYAIELINEAHAMAKASGAQIVDAVSFNIVMKGFAQVTDRRECFRCVELMATMGLQPDDITINTLVEVCVADSAFDTANDIIESLRKEEKVGVTTYTALVKSLIRAGRLAKALHIYQDMKNHIKSPPDVMFFSMVIKALIDRSRLDEALSVVADMNEAGHAIDDIILTHLLDGCRREGRLDLGKNLFQKAVASGVRCSDYSIVMMLKLYGAHGCNEEAYSLLTSMKADHGLTPSVAHCTCVASYCFRNGNFDTAWLVCEELMRSGIKVDDMAASTLLQGFANAQQWNRLVTLATWTAESLPIPERMLTKAVAQLRQNGGQHAQETIRKLEGIASKNPPSLGTR